MKWLIALICTALIGSAVVAFYFENERSSALTVALPASGDNSIELDPAYATDLQSREVLWGVSEGLTRLRLPGLEPEPAAAESWTVDETQRKFTFHLRKNLKWSNGDAMSAEDFVASWRRLIALKPTSPFFWVSSWIDRFPEFAQRQASVADVGFRALSSRDIEIRTSVPFPELPFVLALPHMAPIHASARALQPLHDSSARAITNGPYFLASVSKERIVVARNLYYWDLSPSTPKWIEFLINLHDKSRAVDRGDVDLAFLSPYELDDKTWSEPLFTAQPSDRELLMILDCGRKPFDDARVRKALSLAIDRTALARSALWEADSPLARFVPSGLWDYPEEPVQAFDVSEARRLLVEAGFADRNRFPRLTILAGSDPMTEAVVRNLEEQWRRNLSIDVGHQLEGWAAFDNARKSGKYLAYLDWKESLIPLPVRYIGMFSIFERLAPGWNTELVDRAVYADGDPKIRHPWLHWGEEVLLSQMPAIPLLRANQLFVSSVRVGGFVPNAIGAIRGNDLRKVSR